MALTPRQKQVLDFISQWVEENGYCPSYEEIAKGLQLASLATIHKHISALEAKNYLKRSFNHSRSLELAPRYFEETGRGKGHAPVSVPLAGQIAAGLPVETYAQSETLSFSDFAGDKDTFALEVRGDSMIEDHILSGDYVLVEKTGEPRNGDIVVAMVDGSQTTLKRFYRESEDMIRLQPANPSMEPIRVPAAQLAVQGRVLAVLRRYH